MIEKQKNTLLLSIKEYNLFCSLLEIVSYITYINTTYIIDNRLMLNIFACIWFNSLQ